MQVRKLCFKLDVIVRIAADVACAAGSSADGPKRPFHSCDHRGMLPHR